MKKVLEKKKVTKNLKSGMMAINKIVPDENQPRKYFDAQKMATLRASIRREGIINPVVIGPMKGTAGKFRLIDGERRFRAAVDEKLKEVPYVLVETENEVDRLLQQFQIQEMHEGWTPVEKAAALENMAEKMGQTLLQVCKMLGISPEITRRYVAFSMLADKAAYIRSEIPLEYADHIKTLKNAIKRVLNDAGKPFEFNQEKAIEQAVVKRIKDGTINSRGEFMKMKDAIVKNPKYIEKITETNMTPEAMFYESKAQGAFHLRNAVINAGYLYSHLNKFMKTSDVKLSDKDISFLKLAQKSIHTVLGKVEL